MTRMILPDVSFYQYKFKDSTLREITGWIDFERMQTHTPAVIIRAGQNLWKDVAFNVSWTNAKAAGLMRGSYWFYDSRADPKKQAQLWVSILGDDLGELPMFADFEDNYGGNFGKWQDWYTFLEEVKRLVPDKQIMIYTAYYYWRKNTIEKGINVTQLNYFKQYPLWVAHYNVTSPLIPQPWSEWEFWQITDKGDGKLYGVQSANIDLNYFDGTHEEFMNKYGGEWEPPIPPDEGDNGMTIIATLKSNDTARRAVRYTPKVEGNPVGYANPASVIMNATQKKVITVNGEGGTGSLVGDEWYFVENVDVQFYGTNNYGKASGWVAAKHKGEVLCIVTPVNFPPPSGELPPFDLNIRWDGEKYTVTFNDKPVTLP